MAVHSDSRSEDTSPNSHHDDHNEGSAHGNGLETAQTDMHSYHIREQPMGTKRKVKVVLMGAGASSLNFLKKAEEQLRHVDIACYEKNADVGGTWLENRYLYSL